ncbi:MAG: serine hydrolase, partial [Cruoricaptor ignavus]|nr:serine hydrolase [Cruoricaptor ignavus]
MRYISKVVILMAFSIIFLSCKKEVALFESEPKTHLPNFGNVNTDGVFHRKDGRLKDKDSLEKILDN